MATYLYNQVEASLVPRVKGRLQLAQLSILTEDNPDLIDPISTALRAMGIVPATLGELADADFASVTDDTIDELLDRATLNVLKTILGNLNLVNIKTAHRSEDLSDLHEQIEAQIKALTETVNTYESAGSTALQSGVLSLDFQSKPDDIEGGVTYARYS